jgi:hypothetical protein
MMKSILSRVLGPGLLAIPLLCVSLAASADGIVDPIEMSAGLVAFSELCATRFPQMKDARDRLLRHLESDCKVHNQGRNLSGCERDLAHLQAMPGFSRALENARAQVKTLPAEDVWANCEAMNSDLPK